MASSSKTTAVHFVLIGSVIVNLALAVMLYLFVRDYNVAQQDLLTKTQDLNDANGALSNSLDDIESLKQLLGANFTDITGSGPNTVEGATRALMDEKYGEMVVATQIAAMRSEIDQKNSDLAAKEQALNDQEQRMLSLEAQYRDGTAQIQQSQTESETNLQNLIASHNEQLTSKDQTINQLRRDVNQLQVEREEIREQMLRMQEEKDEEIANLTNINTVLRQQLDEVRRVSFETADGEIRSIDNTTRTVWINLGELDKLRPEVTFSVYDKNNYGVGGDPQDIKAQVEVTRILGPHLSEARILDEDLFRPIAPGDEVYSPVWTAGLVEEFAFVGQIDIDQDGRSDRAVMHDMLANAGARVKLEVNDDGDRVPENAQIDVNTKFLVRGFIPDPADFATQDEKQLIAKKMFEQLSELEKEANQHGVRIVRLNDFLSYMGYKPQQRLYLPGSDAPFTLRQGSRSTAVDSTYGDRTSSGQTSELFRRHRASGRGQSSSGQTSKLYGN